jgi:hypothetical protein
VQEQQRPGLQEKQQHGGMLAQPPTAAAQHSRHHITQSVAWHGVTLLLSMSFFVLQGIQTRV